MNLYTMLRQELALASSFTRPKHAFIYEIILVCFIYVVGYLWLLLSPSLMINITLLICLAFAAVQSGFIAHEASHGGISTTRKLNNNVGQIFLTLLTGVSYAWFCHIHRQHHASPEDPREPSTYGGTLSLVMRMNEVLPMKLHTPLLWAISILRAFSMHIDSLHYLYSQPRHTRTDQLFMLAHLIMWFILPSVIIGIPATMVNYILLNLFTGMYIGPLLLLSHANHPALSQVTGHHKNSRMLHNLMTTRNINNTNFSELILKGTREHIEHHLFPSIPNANLPQARVIIQSFCQRYGLNYNDSSLTKALKKIGRKSFNTQM